jgi:RHS repeat-associated protein
MKSVQATLHNMLSVRNLFVVGLFLAVCLTYSPIACAQVLFGSDTDNGVSVGVPAFSTTTNGPDQINLGNLNVNWEFPIFSKPGRGIPFKLALAYNTAVWKAPTSTNVFTPVSNWGWSFVGSVPTGSIKNVKSSTNCSTTQFSPTTDNYGNYSYTDSSGISHTFRNARYSINNCTNVESASGSTAADDGSGYLLSSPGPATAVVTLPSGQSVLSFGPPGSAGNRSLTDTNGNFVTVASAGNTVTDTLGMAAVTIHSSFTTSGPFFPPAVPSPGIPAASGFVKFTYTDANGISETVTLNYAVFNVQTSFNTCANFGEAPGSFASSLPVSLVYPDGSSYTFSYEPTPGTSNGNVTGRISAVTLRTGGKISYVYGGAHDGLSCDTTDPFSTISLTRQSPDGTTTYSRNNVSASQWKTAITYPPDSTTGQVNQTDIYFQQLKPGAATSVVSYFETKRQVFSGPDTASPVQAVYTCYNGAPADCSGTGLTWPFTEIARTTQLANGLKKQTVMFKNAAGLTTEVDDYDWGTNAPGPLLRKTLTSYATLGNNILNRPFTVTTQDGGANQLAQVQYFYDEVTPDPTSGVPNHKSVSGSRGNATTVKRWLNTTNTLLPTTNEYDDTGNLVVTTDPLGYQTKFSYLDNFADGVNRNSLAYVSQTTYPDTSSPNLAHHIISVQYEPNTGLKVSSTDQNGNVSNYAYDLLGRPQSVTLPPDSSGNRAQTTVNYPDANTVTVQKPITTALSDTSTGKLDGLGRTVQTLHTTPGGVATVDAQYDSMGRILSVTNPYFSTSDPTYGLTKHQYDALNRSVRLTKQDGSAVTVDYSGGNCTVTTDEAGNPRRSCVDGLGRLVEVDEPGDSFAGVSAAGSLPINSATGLQSTVVGAQPATYATDSVTINGSEQAKTITLTGQPCPGRPSQQTCTKTITVSDSGSVTLSVNGTSYSATFTGGSSASGIAQTIAGEMVNDSNVAVQGVTNNSSTSATINLQARNSGAGGNSIAISSTYTYNSSNFSSPSFTASPATSTMAGGSNGSGGTTVYDAGTVSVTIGSFSASVSYGQPGNNSSTAVASALASALSSSSSPVTASSSGSSINIQYKTAGSAGNVGVSCTSSTNQGSYFSTPSFTCNGSSLSGGLNSEGPSLDHNYFVTQYAYDALGNLTNVTQKGDTSTTSSSQWRVRNFSYDSLSRLLSATNPESGTITYVYDADGNMLQKTSPAPNQTGAATQTISYCYDGLKRVLGKGYGALSCPLTSAIVTYAYDSGTNGIGHLTSLTDQAGTDAYSYDALGRAVTEARVISGISKTMGYGYNLDGSIATLTYPSNTVLTYMPWQSGSIAVAVPSAVTDNAGIQYGTAALYNAAGQLVSFTNGQSATFQGISNSFSYNKRLQPVTISAATPSQTVFSIGYDFHVGDGNTGADNGNVWNIYNYRDHSRDQAFTYDALNRLTSAQNAGTNCTVNTLNGKTEYWGNNYSYDAWGNLTSKAITKCGAENLSPTVMANNQLTGYGYDAAGNMISDPTEGLSLSYDPENRITGVSGYTYTYDANGNRVRKSNGTSGTLYWYMLPGVVAESDLSGTLRSEYVFFNGQRVARRDMATGSVEYYFSDNLKTAAVITDSSGNIKSESDYYPWGGELKYMNSDANHFKFTAKERDESNLDYFGARYYSNGLSRFLTPDWAAGPATVPYADLGDPQSLNLYNYVRNRPTVMVDPEGHFLSAPGTQSCTTNGDSCSTPPVTRSCSLDGGADCTVTTSTTIIVGGDLFGGGSTVTIYQNSTTTSTDDNGNTVTVSQTKVIQGTFDSDGRFMGATEHTESGVFINGTSSGWVGSSDAKKSSITASQFLNAAGSLAGWANAVVVRNGTPSIYSGLPHALAQDHHGVVQGGTAAAGLACAILEPCGVAVGTGIAVIGGLDWVAERFHLF